MYLFRDVGMLKNLEVSDGDVLAIVVNYDGRMYRSVLYGEHMCISFATDEIMASLSHWSVVYGNVGWSLFNSAGVISHLGWSF